MRKYLRFFLFFCLMSFVVAVTHAQAQFYSNDRQDGSLDNQRQRERQQVLDRLKNQKARQNQENEQVRAAVPAHLQNRVYVDPNQISRQRQAPGVPQSAYVEEEKPRGFFDWLFGNKREEAPRAVAQPTDQSSAFVDPDGKTGVGGKRTICVRLCDGAFMPISTGRSSKSERDVDLCQAQCPGAETKVFGLNGDNLEDATSSGGESYSNLPNAFKYKTTFVPACACRPQGKTWAEFAAAMEDPTMKKGDKVLSAEQAKQMSIAPNIRKTIKDIELTEKEKANYVLKTNQNIETASITETAQTGEIRIIKFEPVKKQEENLQLKSSSLDQLLKNRHKNPDAAKISDNN